MYTRIFEPPTWLTGVRFAVFAATASLAGCLSVGNEAPRQVAVTSDLVTITGPRGFCVEPSATRQAGDTGFVILGNCASISGSALAPQPSIPALLTAAVSERASGATLTENIASLSDFFRSEDGRALLSRVGEAESVEILETRTEGDRFFLHARDTSPGRLAGVSQDYWRVYLDIGQRLATLSVLALADQEVADADALDALRAFSEAVAQSNAGG